MRGDYGNTHIGEGEREPSSRNDSEAINAEENNAHLNQMFVNQLAGFLDGGIDNEQAGGPSSSSSSSSAAVHAVAQQPPASDQQQNQKPQVGDAAVEQKMKVENESGGEVAGVTVTDAERETRSRKDTLIKDL